MVLIGQLVVGVVYEINNLIGYVYFNLGSLQEYLCSLFIVIEVYECVLCVLDLKVLILEIDDICDCLDIDFISCDLLQLMVELCEGIEWVICIVCDLKDFLYFGCDELWKLVDLYVGLELIINIIWNEFKYKVILVCEFGQLFLVECLLLELNQVYMNLLFNVGYVIVECGMIMVCIGVDGDYVWVEFEDIGGGILLELCQCIFDLFFIIKLVGSGIGLGLLIFYSIINKYYGCIDLDSMFGVGLCFCVVLLVKQLC